MKRLCALIAAAMMATAFMPEQALSGNTYEFGGACNGAMRITRDDATCLSGGWSNSWSTPPGGYKHWVESHCADYGTVVAHHDTIAGQDRHWTLTDSGKETYEGASSKTRDITCCLDDSDLCYRNQVEANDRDRITVISEVNGAYNAGWQDVSTHQLRYDFCQANTNNIYCTNDPSGDANRVPGTAECGTDSTLDCNCGDHFCTVDDCNSAWDGSPAVDTCADASWNNENSYTMTISATDGSSQTCNITVDCMTGGVADDGVHAEWADGLTWSASVGNFDDLRNCEGTLEDGSCANDNEVTRNAAGTVVVNGN